MAVGNISWGAVRKSEEPVTRVGFWLTAAMLSAAGCNAVLGVERLPAGQLSFSSEVCTACMDAHCATGERRCEQSELCRPLFDCLAGCGLDDPPCRAACRAAYPLAASQPEAAALEWCQRRQCLDECLGSGGLARALGEECTGCVDLACPDEIRACVADADCERVMACSAGCTEPECALQCYYGRDGGDGGDNQPSRAMNDCLLECPEQCDTGRHWDCVDRFSWGVKPAGLKEVEYSLRIQSLLKVEPPVGVDVEPCLGVSNPCVSAGEPGVVDGEGRANVTLQMMKFAWEGYFLLSGERQTVDPAGSEPIMPQLFFVGRPVTRSETRVGTNVFTEQEYHLSVLLAGRQLDDQLGHLAVIVWDCLWGEAPGVKVQVNDEAKVAGQTATLYLVQDSVPAVDVDGTMTTDRSGGAGVINLNPGLVHVTVTSGADDRVVSSYTVLVAENSVTTLFAMPNPL